MKNSVIEILIVLLLSGLIFAQEGRGGNFTGGKIKGKVIDSATGDPIEYVNIIVYSQMDSSLITGGVTNKEGFFNISVDRSGSLYLEIKFIGYDIEVRETRINRNTKTSQFPSCTRESRLNYFEFFPRCLQKMINCIASSGWFVGMLPRPIFLRK